MYAYYIIFLVQACTSPLCVGGVAPVESGAYMRSNYNTARAKLKLERLGLWPCRLAWVAVAVSSV